MSNILSEVNEFLEDMHIIAPEETIKRSVELREKVQAARESEGGEAVAWEASGPRGKRLFHDKTNAEMSAEIYGGDARALVYGDTHPPKQQSREFVGWYCAHCQRGVDGSEVTFNEQHQECGRVITNDEPPAPQPDKWIPEGWKLVPVSATRSMQEAGCCVPLRDRQSEAEWMGEIYQSMLDAVPTPPEQKSE